MLSAEMKLERLQDRSPSLVIQHCEARSRAAVLLVGLVFVSDSFSRLRGKPFWHSRTSIICTSEAREEHSCRMLKKARLLTRPTLARRDAPASKQGRSE